MKDIQERKKLWLKAHVIHQERLKIKEWNLLIDKAVRHGLFLIAAILGMFTIMHLV